MGVWWDGTPLRKLVLRDYRTWDAENARSTDADVQRVRSMFRAALVAAGIAEADLDATLDEWCEFIGKETYSGEYDAHPAVNPAEVLNKIDDYAEVARTDFRLGAVTPAKMRAVLNVTAALAGAPLNSDLYQLE